MTAPPGSADDRRAQVRVPGSGLGAEFILGPGRTYVARVVNTSANGARLEYHEPREAERHLALGTLVEVRFRVPGTERALVTLGQVGNLATEGDRVAVGIRFVERDRFYGQLTPRLWERFNRRRRVRARLDSLATQVRWESGERHWTLPCVDLSEIGIGVEVPFAEADDIGRYELARAVLELPRGGGLLVLGALLVHQTEFGHGVRHGSTFDPAHTADLAGQQGRIDRFVRSLG